MAFDTSYQRSPPGRRDDAELRSMANEETDLPR